MVDLYTVLKMICVLGHPDRVVYMRQPEDEPEYRATEIMTVKEVTEKYDLRSTKVKRIDPYFICGEYEGVLLTVIKEGEYDRK